MCGATDWRSVIDFTEMTGVSRECVTTVRL
jgi:hypothetical protein